MKTAFALTFAAMVLLGTFALRVMAQADLKHLVAVPATGARPVSLTARSIERGVSYPSVINLRGSVEINAPVCLTINKDGAPVCDGDMVVHADEAEFHEDTGEIHARGDVRIIPLHHRK